MEEVSYREYARLQVPDMIIGIDPGKGGGIAHFRDGITKAVKMPMDSLEMQEYLNYLKSIATCPFVFIEKLGFRNNNRNIPGLDFMIQKMLDHYRRLVTVLDLSGMFYIEVHPKTWQTYLHLVRKKKDGEPEEEHDERKRRYRDASQVYYPNLKANLWNCDALLLIEFGRRKIQFEKEWVLEEWTKKIPSTNHLFPATNYAVEPNITIDQYKSIQAQRKSGKLKTTKK